MKPDTTNLPDSSRDWSIDERVRMAKLVKDLDLYIHGLDSKSRRLKTQTERDKRAKV